MALKSPLDSAKPHQLIWSEVAPVLEACRKLGNPTYVYFIGEEDDGFLKIGLAKNPFNRRQDMQVGNPRRLRIERLLVGDKKIEGLLHELWFEYRLFSDEKEMKKRGRPRTEWFKPEIRQYLMPIIDDAKRRQLEILEHPDGDSFYLTDFEKAVRDAHIEAQHEAHMVQPVFRLTNHGVVPHRSSPI